VHAVTTVGKAGAFDPGFALTTSRNDLPRLIRIPAAARALIAAARQADVIYSIGLYSRSALAATLYRVPLVLKLAQDPAYERAYRLGLFSGTLEEFQRVGDQRSLLFLKRLRKLIVSRASRVVIPSRYLADIASGWGLPMERFSVIPNPAPSIDRSTPRDVLRRRLGIRFPTFVFVGRLVPAKNLPLAISALRHVPDASLVLIGDGPERDELVRATARNGVGERVSMKGALPRTEAIEWLRAADAAVLSSDWENFPHAAVEALAAGTPVIATSVGGVPEIVEHGISGILVPPGDVQALGAAMASLGENGTLLESLREGARRVGSRYHVTPIFEALERELELALRSG
jgi:glycosyltransferase involved in cell wall biosynthesis